MARRRQAAAVACIALVALVAVLPLGGVALDWVVVPPTFVLLPALTPSPVFHEPFRDTAPQTGHLRAIDTRGPPRLPFA